MELLQSPVPLYYQLKSHIRDKIKNKEWLAGTLIPSERNLERMFNLSRTPVRQAIGELVMEGYLVKRHGKGTYVADQTKKQTTKTLVGLVEYFRQRQLNPVIKLRHYSITDAPDKVAEELKLSDSRKVIAVRRQIAVGNCCPAVDDLYFNANLAEFITPDNLGKHTVFELFENNGIHVKSGSQIYTAVVPESGISQMLQLEQGAPALVIKTVLFNNRDLPLHYATAYCNPAHYEQEIQLSR